jgi:HK97 family phage prohead protease
MARSTLARIDVDLRLNSVMEPGVRTNERMVAFRLDVVPDADGEPQGRLAGYASVYNKPFRGEFGMEQLNSGVFAQHIAEKGNVIPIFYQHGWAKMANAAPIGHATVEENSRGLKVDAQLYIDTDATAASVFRAAQAGALKEWSIGYIPITITQYEKDGATVEAVDVGTLLEASVVVKGANPWTTMPIVNEAPKQDADAEFEAACRYAAAVERAYSAMTSPGFRETIRETCYGESQTDPNKE